MLIDVLFTRDFRWSNKSAHLLPEIDISKKPQRYSYGIDVLFICCTRVLRWSEKSPRLLPGIDKSKNPNVIVMELMFYSSIVQEF
ncbi:MAG: hypothetical protein SWX82_14940 [Cyanobacteriota bacterium]|nr:hypothetical protein [Cyanobacteriota bacterium]